MRLKSLSILNFKNYAEASLNIDHSINLFLGNNGEGKTNLLDAIYYLSFCKSYFNPIDSHNVRYGEPFFVIQGIYDKLGKEEELYCGFKNGKKIFKRNKKEYNRFADHIGQFPLVMISPNDNLLILEGSELRRKFIDGIIAQFNKIYLEKLIAYNKVLTQRNALLKRFSETRSFDKDSLVVWDVQLVEYGQYIYESRRAFLESYIPIFQQYYEWVSKKRERVSLVYETTLNEKPFEVLLEEALLKDRKTLFTNVGIHKDDLGYLIEGKPLKKFGSQGQQKTFLIALKLAQAEYIKRELEIAPILLLDDIYDKLDDDRVGELMQLVNTDTFGQVFITDTATDRLPELLNKTTIDFKKFIVKNGEVHYG